MRPTLLISSFLLSGTITAQLSWVPCTLPMNTLINVALGPNGELVTFQPTNPIQPMVSEDHGQTWQTRSGAGGPNGQLLSDQQLGITITGTILIWGSVNGGSAYGVWRSTDGGDSFTQLGVSAGIPATRFFFGFTSNPNGGVYLYGEGVLYSQDDGLTWTSIVPAQTGISALTASSAALFGAQLNAIYRSELDGTGFDVLNTGSVSVTNGLDLVRGLDQRIIAVGGTDKVITTSDDGDLWSAANTGLGSVPAEWEHVSATLFNDHWVIGKQISVRFTSDAGASWAAAESGLELAQNEPIQDIFCDSTGTFYLYGYFHLYRSEFSTEVGLSGSTPALVAYPNPTTGPVRVPSRMAGASGQVLDATGREVLRTRIRTDGTVDLATLNNGSYQLRSLADGSVVPIRVQH